MGRADEEVMPAMFPGSSQRLGTPDTESDVTVYAECIEPWREWESSCKGGDRVESEVLMRSTRALRLQIEFAPEAELCRDKGLRPV